jgi:hypothetical protein
VLKGSYEEVLAYKYSDDLWGFRRPDFKVRKRLSVIFRRAEQPHRLILDNGPVWTIWIKFRERRDWGFWPEVSPGTYRWVNWQEYEEIMESDIK